jgi:hypothetical protein
VQNFVTNFQHLIIVLAVIAAAVILGVTHEVTGTQALAVILAAGGFSLGITGASSSITAAATATTPPSVSVPEQPTPTLAQKTGA